jgi:glycosyltransferase involved in cell wall biosynthesis
VTQLRVVLLSEVFSGNMGYLENILPKYLARLGLDVHLITMGLPPSYYMNESREVYRGFADRTGLSPGMVEAYQGYTLHVLAHRRAMGYMRMVGLRKRLRAVAADIVQTTAAIGWLPMQAALAKLFLRYKLFTGNHYHASVFPLAHQKLRPWNKDLLRCRLTRTLPGWLVALLTEKCYAITSDCADVAVRFFGVPKSKIEICPLGVDTELFSPISSDADQQARRDLRALLGFSEHEIVCIYTGRFTEDKNPLLLAKAVDSLAQRAEPFRGLFVGNGAQAQAIRSCQGCVTHPFVPVRELGALFRASDVGVWSTQESTSMLDAAACGLPIVVNHTMSAPERIEGNGLTYRLNDMEDLTRALTALRERSARLALGACGAKKMANQFSWESVAMRRVRDYETALGSKRSVGQPTISEECLEKLD